jgi:hypothetical protein
MDVADLFPPLPYSWTLVLTGVLLIVGALALIAGWILLPRWLKDRPMPVGAAPKSRNERLDKYGAARQEALERLTVIAQEFEAGRIDSRAVHQNTAATLRWYAWQRTGKDTSTMTIREIEQRAKVPKRFHKTFDGLIEPSFGTQEQVTLANPAAMLKRAETVVQRW